MHKRILSDPVRRIAFSLSIHTVTMTIARRNIMHASLTDRRFFWKSAFFLVFPYDPGAAPGYYSGSAIVDSDQCWTSLQMFGMAIDILVRFRNSPHDYNLVYISKQVQDSTINPGNLEIGSFWVDRISLQPSKKAVHFQNLFLRKRCHSNCWLDCLTEHLG